MKNTRRFIAGFSALAMAAAMAMSASAADPTQIVPNDSGSPNPETAGAEVTYKVDAAYTVTIPAGADISSGSDVQSIKANDVLLEQGQKITVTLSKASNTESGKSFSAKDESGESTVKYTIKAGDTDVAVGDKVAEFETKTGEQSATLTFTKDADSTPTFAGTHTETLTFDIAVEDAAPATVLSGALVDGATIKVNFKWRGRELGDYVQGVYNASSGTFTVTKGGNYWGIGPRAVYKVEKSGDNIIIGAGFYDYDDEAMVWTFDTTNDTYTYTQGAYVSSSPDKYGLTSVTLNGTDITSQLTKN